jgi:RimJ/RimL family protein N-acetyltransferase
MGFELLTGRLILRELTPNDIDNVHSVIGDPVAMRWFRRCTPVMTPMNGSSFSCTAMRSSAAVSGVAT